MTLETLIPLKARTGIAALAFAALMMPLPAAADPFFFSTGNPDGKIATAARPESPGKFEIETGDDFGLTALFACGVRQTLARFPLGARGD